MTIPLVMFSPKCGENHDVHDIETDIESMLEDLDKSKIRVDGLFSMPMPVSMV